MEVKLQLSVSEIINGITGLNHTVSSAKKHESNWQKYWFGEVCKRKRAENKTSLLIWYEYFAQVLFLECFKVSPHSLWIIGCLHSEHILYRVYYPLEPSSLHLRNICELVSTFSLILIRHIINKMDNHPQVRRPKTKIKDRPYRTPYYVKLKDACEKLALFKGVIHDGTDYRSIATPP